MLRGVSSKEPMQEGGCAVVRQGPLIAVVGTFVIAVLVLGCGAGGPGNNHGSAGKRSALATKEENTAPEGDRSKAQTAQEPLGLDAKVVSPLGQANLHGSVWVTSAGYGTVSRIDPQSDKVVAKIRVGRGVVDIATDESSGAVWVASAYLPKDYGGDDNPKYSEDRNLTRVDPETNRVVEEIPIEAHSQYGGAGNVAVGEGAVWMLSEDGKLLKVDPATNEIVAMVDVGHWSSHLAIYRGWVWAMVQVKEFRLVRVDPRMMHIVASKDIGPIPKIGEGAGCGRGIRLVLEWGRTGTSLAVRPLLAAAYASPRCH